MLCAFATPGLLSADMWRDQYSVSTGEALCRIGARLRLASAHARIGGRRSARPVGGRVPWHAAEQESRLVTAYRLPLTVRGRWNIDSQSRQHWWLCSGVLAAPLARLLDGENDEHT